MEANDAQRGKRSHLQCNDDQSFDDPQGSIQGDRNIRASESAVSQEIR
jgi:hypothetical protein